MRFHTLAFSADLVDATNDQVVTAVVDAGWSVNANGRFISPADMDCFFALASNDAITRARINSPNLRTLGLPEIFPLNVVAEPTVPIALCEWGSNCPRIVLNDEFGVDASIGTATDELARCALWMRPTGGIVPVPPGKRYTIRGTSTITLVAGAWQLGTITFDQQPIVGQHAVIGMHVTCADAWFARLVFPRNQNMRPGVVTGETIAGFLQDQPFRYGRLGEWGRFDSVQLPQLEVFGHTAGAETAAVILDLVHL